MQTQQRVTSSRKVSHCTMQNQPTSMLHVVVSGIGWSVSGVPGTLLRTRSSLWCVCVAEAAACLSQDKRRVTLPRLRDKQSRARTATLDIIRVLEFDPHLLKSGVVVISDDAPASTALLFIKGAPSVIKDTVVASSIPSGFAKVDHMRLCKVCLIANAMFCIQWCHRDLMLGMLGVSHPSRLCECCSAV